ncbi:MAG: ATP-binding cassette domain-containing protein [Leclercia adecarboxylata]|uniref:ATP-binding cassette domain-containing protein n=1 Tax=Leclercia adecarboxylata TaxID=83655 RepID=A0AAP9DC23_9ENTR|nr:MULTISPECIES: ATP-binding cassette domain-containing protein [Leclercia]MDU1061364.1 ATP-binding cassette domain-containing protein [Leclercia adecarboxylata]MDU1085509.1 ATP-binding cassette domain-containing protein [Leclercia adecarboxylata]MDU4839996.1 ATP-binding cassette domain-containing protein [Leclercia adecarboxylata]QDK19800.1 ATP-binding cassette domain-containing protein [Leclercia adecarboxylata]QGU14428.1 ATP-binding cassette domain-containing protein [Leclercia sp. 119287]
MLSLRAVNQYYGDRHTLWNVDLDLPPGLCTGVVGLPGMGKTTLVSCIAGLLPIASGTMVWHDAGPETRPGEGISFVPQDRRIFSQLTVEENLHVARMAKGVAGGSVSRDVFEFFPELYPLRQHRASGLNDDQQYQLALANALVTRPRLLILDEPSRGTGQLFTLKLAQLLLRFNRELGLSVLLAEQHLSLIRRVADRFCLLYRGRNVAQGRVSELDDPLIAHWMGPTASAQ